MAKFVVFCQSNPTPTPLFITFSRGHFIEIVPTTIMDFCDYQIHTNLMVSLDNKIYDNFNLAQFKYTIKFYFKVKKVMFKSGKVKFGEVW